MAAYQATKILPLVWLIGHTRIPRSSSLPTSYELYNTKIYALETLDVIFSNDRTFMLYILFYIAKIVDLEIRA